MQAAWWLWLAGLAGSTSVNPPQCGLAKQQASATAIEW